MIEIYIDGEKFILKKYLPSDQLRAMNAAYDRVEQALKNAGPHAIHVLAPNAIPAYEMIFKAIQDCFEMTRIEVENLSVFTLEKLFADLYERSLHENKMMR